RALGQARVEVENVAGESLASGRSAQEQGDFAVGRGVLRQVVVDGEHVLAFIAEVLADGRAGVRREVLHRRGVGGRRADDDGVVHRVEIVERLDDLRHGRVLLPDGDVDADNILALLVDDRVERDGGLSGLAVADYKLALAAPDWYHRVNRLESRLQRLLHGLSVNDSGRDALERAVRV